MSIEHPSESFVSSVQPVVLVGGRSRRFGRDKLREPLGDSATLLVQRPISALRAVFGHRVRLVGDCHPALPPLADGSFPDLHPGIGPIGGVVSALRSAGGTIFVLAGDMPSFEPAHIVKLLATAEAAGSQTWATLAFADGLHPCTGVYTIDALPTLEARIARAKHQLVGAIPDIHLVTVDFPAWALANINRPTDFDALSPQLRDGYAEA